MFITQNLFPFVRTRALAAFWIAPVALLMIAASGTISRVSISAGSSTRKVVSTAGVSLPAQPDDQDVHGLVIAIRPTGFVPAEIEVTDGRYLFIVQNRSGIRDLTFRLDRETIARLHEVHDQKLQWKKEFDLNLCHFRCGSSNLALLNQGQKSLRDSITRNSRSRKIICFTEGPHEEVSISRTQANGGCGSWFRLNPDNQL